MTTESTVDTPVALVRGEPWAYPEDLYIPTAAMEVSVEAFAGPLDLLLYLIKRNNLDILDVSIVAVTAQYMSYVDLMQELHLELAAEYLVMAATLAEIKSRMLLPQPEVAEGETDLPQLDLVQQLQEYAQFQQAALDLDALPRMQRDLFSAQAALPPLQKLRFYPPVVLQELLTAVQEVVQRADLFDHHRVEKELLSVQERIVAILNAISHGQPMSFSKLFFVHESRMGVVVTFLAILELIKEGRVELLQADERLSSLYIRAIGTVS